ncbi:MAG: LysR substrate-binding domain-containing protein, partial [Pseudomonadota bacterium]
WKFRTPDGAAVEVKITGNYATNLAEAITEAALTGVGIARKCRWEVSDHLASDALVTVLEDHKILPEWGIFAVRSPSRQAPPRVRAFTDFLAARFQNIPDLSDPAPG